MQILLLKKYDLYNILNTHSTVLSSLIFSILIFGTQMNRQFSRNNKFICNVIGNTSDTVDVISNRIAPPGFCLTSLIYQDTVIPEKVSTTLFKKMIKKDNSDNYVDSKSYGVVVIKICVDSSGNVISAQHIEKGSTTSDKDIVQKAIDDALKWKFEKSDLELQCGTMKYKFLFKQR